MNDRRLLPWLRRGALVALAVLVSACSSVPSASGDVWAQYERALADSAVASPQKVRPLARVPDQAMVQVASWVIGSRKPCDGAGCTFTVNERRMWVTLAGEVQDACRAWGLTGDPLRERLEQLLGLPPQTPPQWRKTHMLTLQVPRAALERPCLGETVDAGGVPRCTPRVASTTGAELRQFVLQQMADVWVHGDAQGGPGYPFTRLGYTYDWHPQAASRGHYGASEFVLKAGTPVVLVAEATTDAYCGK